MIYIASVANLVLYSAQIACIVAIGACLPALLRLHAPAVRYAYWRALALLCLALPWIQPRMAQPARATSGESTMRFADTLIAPLAESSTAASQPVIPSWHVIAGLLAAGAVVRLVWLAAGLVKLRRLRRSGKVAPLCHEHDELQRLIGTRAEMRYLDALAQPATFGVFKPVVLLPAALRDHPADIQRAVLAHELLHVRRRDWAWVLAEELVRAAFWFHPAVWWLISRVQLAREEVVDELAVLVTGHRRTYVEALLAFADETPLAPAAAFARRRHLFRRMLLISREAGMSSKRIVATCAAMALIVALGSWYAVGAFPLVNENPQTALHEAPGPLEQKAVPITPENPVPRRVNVTRAEYPAEATAQNASAVVTLRVTLDELGRVAETRVVGFAVDSNAGQLKFTNVSPAEIDRMVRTSKPPEWAELRRILDAFIRSAVSAVQQWRYDPPYQAPISFPVTINFTLSSSTSESSMPPPPPPPPPPGPTSWTLDGAARVGSGVKAPMKIRDVRPVYPPIAIASRVQGVVILEARIEPDGRVGDVRVLRSIPLLDQAAIDAVRQWQFTPTVLNGHAVPVVMTLTVAFTLRQADEQ